MSLFAKDDLPPAVSLADQIAEVDRELGRRRRTYPTPVRAGWLTPGTADARFAAMQAVKVSLLRLQKQEKDAV